MAIEKEHLEFVVPDLDEGWTTPPGYPDGIKQKILAGKIGNDAARPVAATRINFAP